MPAERPPVGSVYVSSPLGFTAFGRWSLQRLYEKLETTELRVRDPWEWPNQRASEPAFRTADLLTTAMQASADRGWRVSLEIAARNVTELRAADVVLAILDGADVDSGVAAEIGYASGNGKPIVGLRTDQRRASDGPAHVVNLQVQHLIANAAKGHPSPYAGRIVHSIDEAIDGLLDVVRETPAPGSSNGVPPQR